MKSLHGRRIGLLSHAAAVDKDLRATRTILADANLDLRLVLAPEHGLYGAFQDQVAVGAHVRGRDGVGPVVRSLYGSTVESLSPKPEWLDEIDVLLVDLQDIGTRYYTYIWTMLLVMRSCAGRGISVMVLDRPNPLGGIKVEGPLIEPEFLSFVGLHPIPVRHGMTIGELANFFCAEESMDLEVVVVPMDNWERSMYFDETGLPWVLPSPNMPTLDCALVYPGSCLLEGTNLSEGRGTTCPFSMIGAPGICGEDLAIKLAAANVAGVKWRAITFKPTFHKYAGQVCGGVEVRVVDRKRFTPFQMGIAAISAMRRASEPTFEWRREPYEFVSDRLAIDLLAGGSWLRDAVRENVSHQDLASGWRDVENDFQKRRAPYLLYT